MKCLVVTVLLLAVPAFGAESTKPAIAAINSVGVDLLRQTLTPGD